MNFTLVNNTSAIENYNLSLSTDNTNLSTNIDALPEPMQTFSYSQCQNMQIHDEKLMIDTRDNELYTMAKLKDGKCWMTQNLRLKLDTSKPLTPGDSDVQTSWTPQRSTETALVGRWDQDPEGYKTVRSYYDNTKPEYGTYYTHTAATAGTSVNMNNDGDEATGSICPKGWRLPKITDDVRNSEFYIMAKNYINGDMQWHTYENDKGGRWDSGTHNLHFSPQSFLYIGYRNYSSSVIGNFGVDTNLWSSTIKDTNSSRYLGVNNNEVCPWSNYPRYTGFSVRCLVR